MFKSHCLSGLVLCCIALLTSCRHDPYDLPAEVELESSQWYDDIDFLRPDIYCGLLIVLIAWRQLVSAQQAIGSLQAKQDKITTRNSKPAPAGCTVDLFSDELFSVLRAELGIRDDFLNDGWSFDELRDGGGKGGNLMVKVGDYIVKELSQEDHLALLDITGSYLRHVCNGPSRLCTIVMHFRCTQSHKTFLVMTNELAAGDFRSVYDIKGCADDKTLMDKGKPIRPVRKRIWNLSMWGGQCCWSADRVIYYEGKVAARKAKIYVTEEQREQVLVAIHRDSAWLVQEGLMDYSLLVGVAIRNIGCEELTTSRSGPLLRKENDGTVVFNHVIIIDFLQRWTPGKMVAHHLKVLERNKATIPPVPYAARFEKHCEQAFIAVSPSRTVKWGAFQN